MDILGKPAKADYRAVPRVVFTDPELAAVGMSEAAAREAGLDVVTATIDLPTSIARPYTYEEEPRGTFSVTVDRERQVLVGAWAVAPLASEWIHTAVLAIRAEIPSPSSRTRSRSSRPSPRCSASRCALLPEEDTLMPRPSGAPDDGRGARRGHERAHRHHRSSRHGMVHYDGNPGVHFERPSRSRPARGELTGSTSGPTPERTSTHPFTSSTTAPVLKGCRSSRCSARPSWWTRPRPRKRSTRTRCESS